MKIAFIGGGKMGEAMISGLIRQASVEPGGITVSDVDQVLLRDYPLLNLEVPDEDHLRDLEELIRSYDIQTQIGG